MNLPATATVSENRPVFHKPIALTHMRNHWTLQQMRLSNLTICRGYKDGFSEKRYRLTKNDINKWVKLGRTRNREWKNSFVDEFFKPIMLNEYGKDNRLEKVIAMPLYTRVGFIRGGGIECTFNPEAVPYIREAIDLYAGMELAAQLCLDKVEQLEMYELFKGELATSGGKTEIKVRMTIHRFRQKAGIARGKYAEFKYLRRDMIEPVCKKITKETDIKVKWMPVFGDNRRTVEQLEFDVRLKKDFVFELPEFEDEEGEQETVAQDVAEFLVKYRVGKDTAVRLAKNYDIGRIERNVTYAKQIEAAGGIKKTLGGYIKTAIEKDYAPEVTVATERVYLEVEVVDSSDGLVLTDEGVTKEAFASYQNEIIDEYVDRQTGEWLTAVRDQLAKDNRENVFFQNAFKSKGWEEPFVRSAFRNVVCVTAP